MMKKYILESSIILTICLIFWGSIQSVCAQVKTLEADIVIIGGGGAGTTG